MQTAGSAGESLAFGVGVTMPAVMILGFDLEATLVTLVAVLGGLLGILMMIPLRRSLIVDQHQVLQFPEGTACAEVLKAAASAESRRAAGVPSDGEEQTASEGKTIFTGFGVGLAYKALMVALRGWKDIPEKVFTSTLKGDRFRSRSRRSCSASATSSAPASRRPWPPAACLRTWG